MMNSTNMALPFEDDEPGIYVKRQQYHIWWTNWYEPEQEYY